MYKEEIIGESSKSRSWSARQEITNKQTKENDATEGVGSDKMTNVPSSKGCLDESSCLELKSRII